MLAQSANTSPKMSPNPLVFTLYYFHVPGQSTRAARWWKRTAIRFWPQYPQCIQMSPVKNKESEKELDTLYLSSDYKTEYYHA